MPMQIVGMDFKDLEDDGSDQELTAVEALGQGRGINLRCKTDARTYVTLTRMFQQEAGHLTGEEPDAFVIECEMDAAEGAITVTPMTGHPAEGGVSVSEKSAVINEGSLTLKAEFASVIAPDASNAASIMVKVGRHWLVMAAASEDAAADEEAEWKSFCAALTERNSGLEARLQARGLTLATGPREAPLRPSPNENNLAVLPPIRRSDVYPYVSSQEFDALQRAAADGKSGWGWKNNPLAGTRSHKAVESHYVILSLSEQEQEGGRGIEGLEALTGQQDADGIFALCYVAGLLMPESPERPGDPRAWIGLDDVAKAILPAPRSTKEREENRARIWQYLQFGERAVVRGRRSTFYRHPDTGQEIPTDVESPIWRVLGRERPQQPLLFGAAEVPVRVEIVLSSEWQGLLTDPHLAQYLPVGEMLGAIPGNKPGGAWARAAGLALANYWRRHPQGSLEGTMPPKRGEILMHYTPKIAAPMDLLAGDNQHRAIEYWHGMIQIWREIGFVADTGEALKTLAVMKADKPVRGWDKADKAWMEQRVDLRPGPNTLACVAACAERLPTRRPRQLDRPRRGRPRKTASDPK